MTRLVLLILLAAFSAAGQQQTTAKAGSSAPYGVGVQGIVGGMPLPVSGVVEGVVGGIPIPVIGVAGATSDVTLHDNTTPTQHLAIDAAGKIAISNSAFDITDRVARILGHIVCDSGCGSGANDVGLTTAADETATNRSASIAALRLLDTSLTAGSQLIGWKGDATLGAWVNVKNTVAVSGPLTDVQLRASAVPVSAASLPLPSGASTEATLALIKAKTDNLDVALSTRTKPSDTQTVSGTVAVSNSFALDATMTGGSQKAIVRGGAKGATAAADVTSTANGADHQGLDVTVQGTVTVAGTVTTTPPSNASTNVTQWAGTAVDTNSGTKSAGTVRVVIATDQPALTNKLLVTPDSVALPANQSVNVAQVAGTTTDTNSGTKSAGTMRVVLATDQPQLTNKLLVTPDSVALPANQSVNVAQVGGTNTLTGGTAGSLGVGGLAADGSAVSGNPVLVAGKGFNGISLAGRFNCDKRIAFTTLATTATVQQIALVAGQTIYICGWYALISTATTGVNVKWVTGTGTNCATGITDVTPLIFTTPTAAPAISNWNQAPMSGPPVAFSASASALCITQSSATNSTTLSGVIYYTQN